MSLSVLTPPTISSIGLTTSRLNGLSSLPTPWIKHTTIPTYSNPHTEWTIRANNPNQTVTSQDMPISRIQPSFMMKPNTKRAMYPTKLLFKSRPTVAVSLGQIPQDLMELQHIMPTLQAKSQRKRNWGSTTLIRPTTFLSMGIQPMGIHSKDIKYRRISLMRTVKASILAVLEDFRGDPATKMYLYPD